MKKFFKESILFIILFYIIAFALNAMLVEGIRFQKGDEMGVWDDIVKGKIDSDIIISGDSRALTDFDCETLSKETGQTCYNTAINGNAIDLQLARLKVLLKYNRKPKIVLQVVGRATLKTSKPINPSQFLPYIQEPAIYKPLLKINPYYKYIKYFPLYAFTKLNVKTALMGLKGFFKIYDKNLYLRKRGYLPFHSNWKDDFEKFKKKFPNGRDAHLKGAGLKDFKELAKICQKNNIKLYFVYAPEFYESHPYLLNRTALMQFYAGTAKKYNATFLNYFDHDISHHRKYFYNSQHLNHTGAQLLCQTLSLDLKK